MSFGPEDLIKGEGMVGVRGGGEDGRGESGGVDRGRGLDADEMR